MLASVLLALLGLGSSGVVNGQDINITAYKARTFSLFALPKVFGDTSTDAAYNETLEFYKAGCVECVGRHSTTYAHPNACNMYMQCVSFPNQVFIYGHTCGLGQVYDESQSICVEQYNREACSRVGHPCDLGQRIPTDTVSCGPYQVCRDNLYETEFCPSGFGFNLFSGECDIQCPPVLDRQLLNETCSAVDDDKYYRSIQWVRVTSVDGSQVEKPEDYTIPCSASLRHIEPTKCGCDLYNVSFECEDITSVHLSASDNSWNLARNKNAIGLSSSIQGNGTVANSSSDFPGSAYFMGRRTFAAPGLTGNDLGLRFSFTFNFLYIQDPNNDQSNSQDYALADNSICDIEPTYGCKMRMTSQNRARVICYVKPQNQTDLHVEVESEEVDLTGRVTVYFAKDDDKGVLTVTDRSGSEKTATTDFPPGVRAAGNSCPLSIAAGTNKKYFSGYMDDMFLIKHCYSFL
ncbi:uncharacterized protein LOC124150906 [Haliotis rufescens]|uniref:uncharacterized protein LOC124150906 n=1 Tax=Haliotis rufescens TaxID=6454 RepID=UPI00201F305A|nr:uncharacterized protein LOC124150906 [Haliotis rufescens]